MLIGDAVYGDILRDALALLSDRITIALVYGSVARGEENQRSDIDLPIVGDVAFSEVVKALASLQRRQSWSMPESGLRSKVKS